VRDYQILAYAVKQLVEQRGTYTDAVSRGSAKDHAEYKHLCGLIQGLRQAEDIINDLVQKMEKSDD
jgi:hypothetical protein